MATAATYKKIIPVIVSLALFMESLDTTIINTAIPAIAHSLNVFPIDLKVALISYLLSLAIFIPISGWIADKFGIKRVFIVAIGIFTLSSVWCGFANNLTELVIARSLQGLGGSLTLPLGRLIIVRTFKRHELITMMSKVAIIASLGMMLGPVLGGLITHYFTWRWIFWVNIPVGIFAIIMTSYWLKEIPPHKVPPLDKVGFILFGGGLACLTFGLSAFSESDIEPTMALNIILIALVLLACYILYSYKRPNPIVKAQLFKYKTFQISAMGNLLARLGFGAVPFLVPLLLQVAMGYSSQFSGILMAPMALGVFVVKPFAFKLLSEFGYKRLLILNTFLVGLSQWTFIGVNMHTPIYLIAGFTFLFGFVISLQYSAMTSLAYADIDPIDLSAATSIMSTLQQLAQSFGVAVSALLLGEFANKAHLGHHLTVDVFHHTFFAMGIITFCSIFIFMRLNPKDGMQMINSKE